jgi:medium-chain acyl-[acyl-carrier-protein] hydrolase
MIPTGATSARASDVTAGAGAQRGTSRDPERWLPPERTSRRVAATIRLLCLPYAGGGASIYRSWSRMLPPEIEVRPIQLPGRENRIDEPPMRRLDDLCPLLADMLAGALDRPYVLFGHSMGALLAYALTLELAARGAPAPAMLMVSARRAPHLPPMRAPIHDLPEQEFTHRLRQLGGTPPEVFEHSELMELVVPLLRADFALNESLQLPYPPSGISCPVIALGAVDDPEVAPEALAAWRAVAKDTFTLRLFTGGHFYLGPERATLLAGIADLLSAVASHPEADARAGKTDRCNNAA